MAKGVWTRESVSWVSCNLLALVDELALEFLERSQMKRRGETLLQGGGRRAHSLGVASRDAAQRRTFHNNDNK